MAQNGQLCFKVLIVKASMLGELMWKEVFETNNEVVNSLIWICEYSCTYNKISDSHSKS